MCLLIRNLHYIGWYLENTKYDFKIYPFDKLNNGLLQGYKQYYDDYIDIISSKTTKLEFQPVWGDKDGNSK